MASGDLILEAIREAAQQATVLQAFQCVRIVPAELGQEAGIIGAAFLARDALDKL